MPNKDLFDKQQKDYLRNEPLSVRMRPRDLSEFVGQTHILGPGRLLSRSIEADKIASLILFGSPGTGKTTLAHVVSNVTKSHFAQINATTSNVQEIRKEVESAKERRLLYDKKTILFIDEIHRFNKAQQDVLMPDVESGVITLIGATTHNPFFSIVAPLISRSLVFELKPLSEEEILTLLGNALKDKMRGFGMLAVRVENKAMEFWAKTSDGDARRALNALETAVLTTQESKDADIKITLQVAEECIQKKAVVYDGDEDGHYDTISAFIKSMRGSDPDAALYWLAKMIYAGEDLRFIARRIVICAAEDVGLADPQALVVANAAFQISEFIGLPECRIPLAEAAVYIACAPKSNSAYMGIEKALKDVRENRIMEVPDHLKDASSDSGALGHGKNYKYAHNFKDHFVEQEYIPRKAVYYEPSDMGFEKSLKERVEALWKKRQKQ
ncbi:MAG: replication-associated recombination protein A [Candidatus Omnitrophota bacterium]